MMPPIATIAGIMAATKGMDREISAPGKPMSLTYAIAPKPLSKPASSPIHNPDGIAPDCGDRRKKVSEQINVATLNVIIPQAVESWLARMTSGQLKPIADAKASTNTLFIFFTALSLKELS